MKVGVRGAATRAVHDRRLKGTETFLELSVEVWIERKPDFLRRCEIPLDKRIRGRVIRYGEGPCSRRDAGLKAPDCPLLSRNKEVRHYRTSLRCRRDSNRRNQPRFPRM